MWTWPSSRHYSKISKFSTACFLYCEDTTSLVGGYILLWRCSQRQNDYSPVPLWLLESSYQLLFQVQWQQCQNRFQIKFEEASCSWLHSQFKKSGLFVFVLSCKCVNCKNHVGDPLDCSSHIVLLVIHGRKLFVQLWILSRETRIPWK